MKKMAAYAMVGILAVGSSALDLGDIGKSIGKGLESAQDAGLVKTGRPTQKQFDAKVVENARKNVKACKDFYHKHKIIYGDVEDSYVDKDEVARAQERLGEWDIKGNKAYSPFNLKEIEKAVKNDKSKLHAYCSLILQKGLSKSEQEEFNKETYAKYNLINGSNRPNKK